MTTQVDRDTCVEHGHAVDELAVSGSISVAASWSQRRARAAIVWYQRLRDGRPSPCRFFPTCSSYALEAIEIHGTRRGGWLTVRRLLRCRPFGPSGFDPVPPPAGSASTMTASVQKGG